MYTVQYIYGIHCCILAIDNLTYCHSELFGLWVPVRILKYQKNIFDSAEVPNIKFAKDTKIAEIPRWWWWWWMWLFWYIATPPHTHTHTHTHPPPHPLTPPHTHSPPHVGPAVPLQFAHFIVHPKACETTRYGSIDITVYTVYIRNLQK